MENIPAGQAACWQIVCFHGRYVSGKEAVLLPQAAAAVERFVFSRATWYARGSYIASTNKSL